MIELVQSVRVAPLRPKCVTTQKPEARNCKRCGDALPDGLRQGSRYCSRHCQKNSARDTENELLAEIKQIAKRIAYSYLNRDRYLGVDGRYEGPLNKSVTCVVAFHKDKGFRAMPIDVHVKPIEPKCVNGLTAHTEGEHQGKWTKAFRHSVDMPRKHHAYCVNCVEMVIDKAQNKVRVTKGVYLPIEHQCNSVRVYDLKGQLLETRLLL